MRIGIYPGSFDPITKGHLDIITRSSKLFDKVIVAVVENINKDSVFSFEKRKEFIEKATKDIPNIEIKSCTNLLINFAKENGAQSIIRGLRAVTDFEYELQMAQTNNKLCSDLETIFLAARLEYAYLSSSIVKEVAYFGGDISDFVPSNILKEVEKVLKGEKNE